MAKVEVARIKRDGTTVQLGVGNSASYNEGEEIALDQLPDHVVQALRDNDPYTLETLETTAGGYDPGDHKVADVIEHLGTLPAREAAAVIKKEKAGQKRSTIVNWKPPRDNKGGREQSSSTAEGPPIDGYDDLDEAQVISLVESHDEDKRDEFRNQVLAYENENQRRAGIVEALTEKEGD
jgi:hypothetical protein